MEECHHEGRDTSHAPDEKQNTNNTNTFNIINKDVVSSLVASIAEEDVMEIMAYSNFNTAIHSAVNSVYSVRTPP